MSELRRRALTNAIATAAALGVDVPDIIFHGGAASAGARIYAELHPDPTTADIGTLWCCDAVAYRGLAACTCWEPVYDVDQTPPDTTTLAGAMPAKCGDCAFRPDSPERADPFLAEELYSLPDRGDPFWCHDGMRQPARWRHRTVDVEVPGDPADWQPPIVHGIPYRADGHAADLCAGWLALRLAAITTTDTQHAGEPTP